MVADALPRASALVTALFLMASAAVRPAEAMQFEVVNVSPSEVLLGGRGPIVRGDAARLEAALASVPPGKRVLALAVDSPGGTVVDGAELAHIIRNRALPVVVPSNSKCASACFLLFVASPRRLAANDALIGVHSASDDGNDNEVAMAMTTAMARAAAELGAPPVIVGKMVQTAPARMEWLTPQDLASMGVVIYDDADPTAAVRGSKAAAAQAPALVPRVAPQATGFEAEFRGAIFCDRQPTRLELKLLPTSDAAHRRALYTLGPSTTGRPGPTGTFTIEGRVDLAGGAIDLRPTTSGPRSELLGPLGLEGRSEDGGKTFTGRVTTNPRCTLFTLKRMD